jgi:hypothetical protein
MVAAPNRSSSAKVLTNLGQETSSLPRKRDFQSSAPCGSGMAYSINITSSRVRISSNEGLSERRKEEEEERGW